MVAVVVVGGDQRVQRREHLAADTQLFQLLRIAVGQQIDGAGAVVHHAHLHALLRLARQNLQHAVPHAALLDDEVLQEDEALRTLQLAQHLGKLVLAQREVLHAAVLVDREAAVISGVLGQAAQRGVLPLQPLQQRGLVRHVLLALADHLVDALLLDAVAEVGVHVQVQQRTEGREHRDDDAPGQLDRRVLLRVQYANQHDRREGHHAAEEQHQILAQIHEGHEHQYDLQQQQQNDDRAAPERDMEEAALALLDELLLKSFFFPFLLLRLHRIRLPFSPARATFFRAVCRTY